ncbi:ATP-binding cassette sub-family A member 8, partial [Tupaia chinensis]
EWLLSFLPLLLAYLLSSNLHQVNDSQIPAVNLGRVDTFNDSDYIIAFTPESKTTHEIMNKAASAPFMQGRRITGWPDEKSMKALDSNYSLDTVRVIFNDTFSYHLRFYFGLRIPTYQEHRDHSAHCHATNEKVRCKSSMFWEEGFVAFQAAINAAIIEITTNHSVMEELMSVAGINMKILPFIAQGGLATDIFIFFCIISFSALIYNVSVNVAQERQYIKSLLIMMGLREAAFWCFSTGTFADVVVTVFVLALLSGELPTALIEEKNVRVMTLQYSELLFCFCARLSWGVLYAGFIFIIATLMAFIIKLTQVVVLTGYVVVFTLFLLYGLSLITLGFLMGVLIKKPFLTGLVVFLFIVFWGSLGFTALYAHLPAFLEWTLCLLSPFAFSVGMAQLIHLDYDINSDVPLESASNPYLIMATLFMLFFDTLLYLVLTLYFDKILPTEYGHRRSPLFFLKSSFWFRHQRANHVALENETDSDSSSNDCFEPVSPEFHGKEAIRIKNLKKEYAGKHEKVEALRGVMFDIYEGQITALLGHSGAGKTTLLNTLSGLLVPTSGSVTIYNHTVLEIADLETVSKLTGVCPQSNVHFGFLTMRENLRLFAVIKGISPHEVEQEVLRVLQNLEMEKSQDILAENLSGGQKRKLTFGMALLGDPQVLLLDEPTAGLDPLSRHRVWTLLKERKSDRVILFSTQFMDEADILAELYRDLDRCANQGIENYGVSMTTLNEVFLKLEGKPTIDESDIGLWGQLQSDGEKDMGSLAELEQVLSSFEETRTIVSGMALWRQQLCAIAKVRFLKLKNERKILLVMLLVYGISFLPQLLEHLFLELYHKSSSWELSPNTYFLSPGQPPQVPLTHLLVINKTGSSIDNFIHSLRQQNIALEVDALGIRNGTDEPSYNGAIIVAGDEKDHRYSVACNTKRLNCFPVLMEIISNGLLGIFNSSERIKTYRSTYHKKARSQLRISGLYPSAYWLGQALVDIPLYFLILLLIQILDYIFSPADIILIIKGLLIQFSSDTTDFFEASGSQAVFLASLIKPVIIASCLRKEYAGKRKNCFSKKKKKVATRNVSFCVKKGEVIGLLGHNGAGKSTTIKMITGDTKPTAGQENALWPALTVKEHLEAYTAVKGLKKEDAKVAITRLVDALKLQDQLKAPVKTLSEGIKRKVCFVLSILGNPSVVLLDEPTTGMDPEGQQQVWQAIRATFRNTERGALLTTHYMAEAEAVCDRVAIMVSGRLRCIGSIQHLKSKFGKDYLLEMKVKTPTQVEPLHTEILKLFPQAARQERYSSLMVYKLPVEDVRPLSQAFFKLETVKQSFDLEEYSLSQSTLEQVFLELSREQELEGFDEELDPSVKWKLLPQEEP